jgi:hypothetical protein
MTPRQVTFLQLLLATRPAERRNQGVAAEMAAREGIGKVVGARVMYGPADLLAAENTLSTRGFPLVAPAPGFSRSDAPAGGSEKAGAHRVSKGLVAVVPIPCSFDLPQGTRFLPMPWADAARLPHEVVLVCENFETLMRLREFSWLAAYLKARATLAVFRGAPRYFRTDAPAALLRELSTPVLGFFDYDPKGLCMAAALPRLEALCLPPWDALEQAARKLRRDHLFAQQYHVCRAQLDALPAGALASAWARMKGSSLGLNQEGFPR